MVTSQPTGECRRLGDQEYSYAGTFRLLGFRRIKTLLLQNFILSSTFFNIPDGDTNHAMTSWTTLSCATVPPAESQHIPKGVGSSSRGSPACRYMYPTDHRLGQGTHSCSIIPACGNWLLAPPITSVGLRMSKEMVHVAVGYWLGLRTCESHTCPCGKGVDARGLHGLSFRQSSARH